jgi:hypothetical protein
VDGVGNECWQVLVRVNVNTYVHFTLTVEDVASKALANGHAQVDVEADFSDAHAGVIFVFGQ